MLLKSPSFTTLAILTLALGIGASAAIFGVVNGFYLRPLPGKDNSNMQVIAVRHPGNFDPHGPSFLDFQDYRANSNAFSEMAAYDMDFVGIRADNRSDRVFANYVTGDFFATLGLQPALGSLNFPGEPDKSPPPPAMIISYPYWQRRFSADPAIIGKTVTVNGKSLTVVGVAPKGFFGPYTPAEISVFLPFGFDNADALTSRSHHGLYALARPRPGISRAQARASLQLVADNLARAFPATNKDITVSVIPEQMARPQANASTVMPLVVSVFLAMVALVLIVTCVNLANLLLVRAAGRSKELSIRAALGAGRVRLVRQLLTESLLLSFAGGLVGAGIGWWLSKLAASIHFPGDVPLHMDFGFDWRVFAAISAVVMSCGVFAGLVPAWRASRTDLNESLREGGRSNSAGAGRSRLRGALVVAQVSGACIVLIIAGLFIRSLRAAEQTDLGFHPDGVLLASVDLSQFGYDDPRGTAFYRDVISRTRALPGVQSATMSSLVPLGENNNAERVWKEGQESEAPAKVPVIGVNVIDTDYFQTIGIPVLRGRAVSGRDTKSSLPVAVINETMAKQLWPGQDPIGHHFRSGKATSPVTEVVGVVRGGKYNSLFEDPQPYFYLPQTQSYTPQHILQVKTSLPESAVMPQIEKIIHALDPDLPVYDVMTFNDALGGGNGFFLLRVGAIFAGSLGGLSLLLAVIGVYGVISYVTSQRTHEVGIRMAVGAQRFDVLAMVLRQGLALVVIGLGIGLAVSFAVTRFLSTLLFQISSIDPVTFGGVSLTLIAVAAFACYVPARRATRVDPLIALRHE
jgi:putative ABC transport system permease protein